MTELSVYSQFIAMSRYARWLPEHKRRETWEETVDRYMQNVIGRYITGDDFNKIRSAILQLEVMPSMRMLMTAGAALDRDHMAGYNCSFVAVDDVRAFDEILYILTCGTGVGFTVESKYIDQLPAVAEEFHDTDSVIVVADSRIGWATSFRELISLLYAGKVPKIDVSKVRAKGERLRTFGGRASGPEPLVDLFNYCISAFRNAAGRKFTDVEVHGIVCKIAEIVVVGGVRRSALISLTDLGSDAMAQAKSGDWHRLHPEYGLANISATYDAKPGIGVFTKEWLHLYLSKSGERGIYHRKGMKDKTKRIGRRDASKIVGTNPCAEIALRSCGLCNLSEVIVRPTDTEADLLEKVRIASIIGTVQSCFTNFRYVRKVWKNNAEEERLLGVSLSGVFDNPITCTTGDDLNRLLDTLKVCAVATNEEWADKLGINRSVAVTCNKPSGTVSQLVDCAYGMHPRYSRWFIRSIRQDNKDPMTAMLKAAGVPNEPCLYNPDTITIFSFPMKSPESATTVTELDALDHLELWKAYNEYWAEHQVSITVNVEEDQWLDVAAWVYKNFDHLTGVSFLPADNGSYKQAPYQRCTKEEYDALVKKMPNIDWSMMQQFEADDMTTSSRELACVAGSCEIN